MNNNWIKDNIQAVPEHQFFVGRSEELSALESHLIRSDSRFGAIFGRVGEGWGKLKKSDANVNNPS